MKIFIKSNFHKFSKILIFLTLTYHIDRRLLLLQPSADHRNNQLQKFHREILPTVDPRPAGHPHGRRS